MRLGRWVPFPVCSWRNVASRPAACDRFDSHYSPHPWRPALVMRENESAMAKQVEDVHRIYDGGGSPDKAKLHPG